MLPEAACCHTRARKLPRAARLRVVAGGAADDAVGQLLLGQAAHLVVGAPNLERAHGLQGRGGGTGRVRAWWLGGRVWRWGWDGGVGAEECCEGWLGAGWAGSAGCARRPARAAYCLQRSMRSAATNTPAGPPASAGSCCPAACSAAAPPAAASRPRRPCRPVVGEGAQGASGRKLRGQVRQRWALLVPGFVHA